MHIDFELFLSNIFTNLVPRVLSYPPRTLGTRLYFYLVLDTYKILFLNSYHFVGKFIY